MRKSTIGRFASGVVVAVGFAGVSNSQCAPLWQPGDAAGGLLGFASVVVPWDPDGPGPRPECLVVGGGFEAARSGSKVVAAHNVALWDPGTDTWSSLGGGTGAAVNAIAVLPNGHLVVGGEFTTAGGVPAAHIAEWDGTVWSALGAGTDDTVFALHVTAGGELLAGGGFFTAGGVPAESIARWNGSTWSTFGAGLLGPVLAVTENLAGEPLVAGGFDVVGGIAAGMARWDGSVWQPEAGPIAITTGVRALLPLPSGDIVAAGSCSFWNPITSTRHYGVARWDGANWQPLGPDLPWSTSFLEPAVTDVALLPNGDIVVAGWFGRGTPLQNIARSNGSAWSPFANGVGDLAGCLAVRGNGDVVAGGIFAAASGVAAGGVARFDGVAWRALGAAAGAPLNGPCALLKRLADGRWLVGGSFSAAGALPLGGVGITDGVAWTGLGGGTDGTVTAAIELPNGDLVVGGSFTMAGGVPCNNIARWDGGAWHPLGFGITFGSVRALALLPNGELVVGGDFASAGGAAIGRVARWNGSAWLAFATPPPGLFPSVNALLVNDGELLLTAYTFGPPYVARWTGSDWQTLGVVAGGYDLLRTQDGRLLAAGVGVSEWDGTGWNLIGQADSLVYQLAELPGGGIVAAGTFTYVSGVPARGLVAFDGAAWQPLWNEPVGTAAPDALALGDSVDDELWVGGSFTGISIGGGGAGGVGAFHLARLRTGCPAALGAVPTGCTPSSGPLSLVAGGLPFAGEPFRSVLAGAGADVALLGIYGATSSNVPLPFAGAACRLLASPDVLALALPVNGGAEFVVSLPPDATFVGAVLFHQVVQVQLGASGPFELSVSDALVPLIGSW